MEKSRRARERRRKPRKKTRKGVATAGGWLLNLIAKDDETSGLFFGGIARPAGHFFVFFHPVARTGFRYEWGIILTHDPLAQPRNNKENASITPASRGVTNMAGLPAKTRPARECERALNALASGHCPRTILLAETVSRFVIFHSTHTARTEKRSSSLDARRGCFALRLFIVYTVRGFIRWFEIIARKFDNQF